MITKDIVIRRAINISNENEIADFKKVCFLPSEKFSAISIECVNYLGIEKRSDVIVGLLKTLFPNLNKVKFSFVLLEQPDNRITKYKGGWGLISGLGIDISQIEHKKEFLHYNKNKINFILEGEIFLNNKKNLQRMFEVTNNIFFFIGDNKCNEEYSNLDDKINMHLIHNNYVLFFLGGNIEQSNELVIIKNSIKDLEDKLEIFNK